jgi:hypothetical protein
MFTSQLVISLVFFIIGIFLVFFLIRPSIIASKVFFSIFRNHFFFLVLLLLNIFTLVFVTVLFPTFIPLTIVCIIIFGIKIYEWSDDRYLDAKIGDWVGNQKIVFLKLITSDDLDLNIQSMEKFLLMLHGTYGNRSQKDLRTTGKFYEEFTFEIHSSGGSNSIFLKLYKNSLDVFVSATKLYFPTLQFIEVEDPFVNMPKKWQESTKKWKNSDFGELSLGGKAIFPLKEKSELSINNQQYKNTPINQLLSFLESVEGGDLVIIQYIFRPQDLINSGIKKSWEKDINDLRKELATNAAVSINSVGIVNPYTPNEVTLIQNVEKKLTNQVFDVKIRFALFGKTITGKRYLTGIMAYFKNFVTEKQFILPNPKSWGDSPNAIWGVFVDNIYWNNESRKRSQQMYSALLNRSLGSGGERKYWGIECLSCVMQFPSYNLNRTIISNKGKSQIHSDKLLEIKEKLSISLNVLNNENVIEVYNPQDKLNQLKNKLVSKR